MVDYRGCFKKIAGDILIIGVSPPIVPLKGVVSQVDWITNAVISKAIAEKRYTGKDSEALLINTKELLPVDKTVVLGVGTGKNLRNDVVKILKGLKIRSFSIMLPRNIKSEFKGTEHNLGDERLIVVKDINL